MCGIVGYIGSDSAKEIIIEGLKNWSIGDTILQVFRYTEIRKSKPANSWEELQTLKQELQTRILTVRSVLGIQDGPPMELLLMSTHILTAMGTTP